MKKITALMLAILMIIPLCLAGCTEPDDPSKHDHEPIMVKVEAKSPTCTENGNKEYYRCTQPNCDRIFTDETAKNEILDKNSVIIPAAHTFNSDGICDACGTLSQEKTNVLQALSKVEGFNTEAKLGMSMGDIKTGLVTIDGHIAVSVPKENEIELDLLLLQTRKITTVFKQQSLMAFFIRNGKAYSLEVDSVDFTSEDLVEEFREYLSIFGSGAGFQYLGTLDELMQDAENGDLSDILPPDITMPDLGEFEGFEFEETDQKLITDVIDALEFNIYAQMFTDYEKTENGYTLTLDLYEKLEGFLDTLASVADEIDTDKTKTLIQLLESDSAKKALRPYFENITGAQLEQIMKAVKAQIPHTDAGEYAFDIPSAGDLNGYDYIVHVIKTNITGTEIETTSLLTIIQNLITESAPEGDATQDIPNLAIIDLSEAVKMLKAELIAEMKLNIPKFEMIFKFSNEPKLTDMRLDMEMIQYQYEYDEETFEETLVGSVEIELFAEIKFLSAAPKLCDLSGLVCYVIDAEVDPSYTEADVYGNFFDITLDGKPVTDYECVFTFSDYAPSTDSIYLLINGCEYLEIFGISDEEPSVFSYDYIEMPDGVIIVPKEIWVESEIMSTQLPNGTKYFTIIGSITDPDNSNNHFDFICEYSVIEKAIPIE